MRALFSRLSAGYPLRVCVINRRRGRLVDRVDRAIRDPLYRPRPNKMHHPGRISTEPNRPKLSAAKRNLTIHSDIVIPLQPCDSIALNNL